MARLLRKLAFCSKTETQQQRSEMECAVCQDLATNPCTVPCGNHHVFCLACLQGIVSHNNYVSHFPCPLCRTRVRIPIGGVAAFRQGKGRGSRFLARLPALRPRCRRRQSLDSLSSDWPDEIALAVLGPLENYPYGGGAPLRVRIDSNSDSDDISSMGIPSEGAESIRHLNLENWLDIMNVDVEIQAAILEEIQREREQRGLEQEDDSNMAVDMPAVMNEEVSSSVLEEPVSTEGGQETLGDGSALPREAGVVDMPILSGEMLGIDDLDMFVVMQLIADMEENETLEGTNHATESNQTTSSSQAEASNQQTKEDETQCHAQMTFKVPQQISLEAAEELNEATERSSSHAQYALSSNWKDRTITDTAIPRPKLSLPQSRSLEQSSPAIEMNSTDIDTDGPCYLHQQESDNRDNSNSSQQELQQNGESRQRNQEGMQVPTEQSTSPAIASSSTAIQGERERCTQHSLDSSSRNNMVSETQTRPSSNGNASHPQPSLDYISVMRISSQTEPVAGPSNAPVTGREAPRGLSPEEWRRQELQKLRSSGRETSVNRGRTGSSRGAGHPLDATVVISEDPDQWARRIRSLQRRRRGQGLAGEKSLTRSHSVGDRADRQASREGGVSRTATDSTKKDANVKKGTKGNVTVIDV